MSGQIRPSSPVSGANSCNKLELQNAAPLSPDLSRALLAAASQLIEQANKLLQAAQGRGESAPALSPGLPPSLFPLSMPEPVSVSQAVNEFLRAKARAGRSDRYLRQLRVSLQSFVKGRAGRPLGQITVSDVERWLDTSEWAARTCQGYLTDVRTLFNWAQRRGLVTANPAAAVETPVDEDLEPPCIHTPAQVATVLEYAREQDLTLARELAIRYFAGLRSSEVARLQESEIRLDAGIIEIPARKAKTRRRRPVTIQPNLRAWLQLGGELPLHDHNTRLAEFTAALFKARGVEWGNNVTRHSFVSYHLAQFENAAKTALQAGHTEQMVFQHYRALVTPAAAAEYWQIQPR